jgi:hypothetical protein
VCIWSRRLSLAACLLACWLWIFVATNFYFEEEEEAAAAAAAAAAVVVAGAAVAARNILSLSSSVWRDQVGEERKN